MNAYISTDTNGNNKIYLVLINGEAQYSIWHSGKKIPNGWSETGKSGSKEECLSYIDEVWVDMRPLSLRGKWRTIGIQCQGSN